MTRAAPTPVVFVHGLWMHPSSWDNWVELFGHRGYRAVAARWPGDAGTVADTRRDPDALANRGIAEITDHVAAAIADLPATPIVIGHSFGGLIAQRLLGMGFARACVAIAPAQFRGILRLPLTQLRTVWPILSHPRLRTGVYTHTPETFHAGFANAVPRTESDEILQTYGIPAPARPLFQAGFANLTPRSEATVDTRRERGPLLLVAGGLDRTVPAGVVRAAHTIQRRNPGVTEFASFADRGHSLPVDHGWREIADAALEFLARNGLAATTPTTHPASPDQQHP